MIIFYQQSRETLHLHLFFRDLECTASYDKEKIFIVCKNKFCCYFDGGGIDVSGYARIC